MLSHGSLYRPNKQEEAQPVSIQAACKDQSSHGCLLRRSSRSELGSESENPTFHCPNLGYTSRCLLGATWMKGSFHILRRSPCNGTDKKHLSARATASSVISDLPEIRHTTGTNMHANTQAHRDYFETRAKQYGGEEHTLRQAMVSRGSRVKGTRQSSAGWAALNTSEDRVAVISPATHQTNTEFVHVSTSICVMNEAWLR